MFFIQNHKTEERKLISEWKYFILLFKFYTMWAESVVLGHFNLMYFSLLLKSPWEYDVWHLLCLLQRSIHPTITLNCLDSSWLGQENKLFYLLAGKLHAQTHDSDQKMTFKRWLQRNTAEVRWAVVNFYLDVTPMQALILPWFTNKKLLQSEVFFSNI